jgi:hypothetical protein
LKNASQPNEKPCLHRKRENIRFIFSFVGTKGYSEKEEKLKVDEKENN